MTITFRHKLTFVYSSVTICLILIFVSALYLSFKNSMIKEIDRTLLAEARIAATRGIADNNTEKIGKVMIKKTGNEYVQVSNIRGDISITSLKSGNLSWPIKMPLIEKAFKGTYSFDTVSFRGEPYRVLHFPVDKSRILRLGYSLQKVDGELKELRNLFFFFLPFLLITVAIFGYHMAGRTIVPVVRLTETADKIKKGNLKERIQLDSPGLEIRNLVKVFNDMLDSIQKHVEGHKRFTSDVSHEIRSPLTALKGSIEVTLRRKRKPEEYEDILKKNLFEVNRLHKISDNLLLLARADHDILELRKSWVDINELLGHIVERHKNKILEKSLDVIEEYQEPLEFLSDRDLLDEALSNLFDNALKYTPDKGSIFLKTEQSFHGITVTFHDTGPGIPEKDRDRVFERFYRVDKTRSRLSGGSGLGLAITKWIIETHGGNISVRNHNKGGAIFTITLPVDDA
ncbi:MAG: HAMP domain-containing histidine kinase [Nitrospirae bacterium]|nr:HAMP domain-containing histidine kinase [Nitrospirota bacterium]